jgi:hypothetical protein
MEKLLRQLIPSLNNHLSDDQLASLFCGELSLKERWIAQRHLATCWPCRLRREELEGPRADRFFEHYLIVRPREALPEEREREFSRKLRLQIQSAALQRRKALRFPTISLPELSPMSPALVICMVFGFATILSFSFWWQQRAPRITSNALLVRAEKWDTTALAPTHGVVYQAVRITMTDQSEKETINHSIYRDTQGKRKPRRFELDRTEAQIKNTLIAAGLDWNEPLSASDYQQWHDRQHVREDHIAWAGSHLLRLTTTVPQGVVAEQSLTVRDTDFHPVRRTVALRDNGTVEIAEVDFKILPWGAVNPDVFEPLETASVAAPIIPARVLPFPHLPAIPTEEQLDAAELGARLVLNQLRADTGEPIAVHRGSQSVIVDGLVETEERRRALQAALQMVPHVTDAIQSNERLQTNPPASSAIQSVAVASMPDQPSPLAVYLQARGRSTSDINDLAQRLFSNALTISQESKEISDLQARFGPTDTKTLLTTATLAELLYSHHERLKAALQHERALLAEAANATPTAQSPDAMQTSSLLVTADRNLALARELTQTNRPAVRTADKILAEMSFAMNELAADVRQTYTKPQSDTTLSGKK